MLKYLSYRSSDAVASGNDSHLECAACSPTGQRMVAVEGKAWQDVQECSGGEGKERCVDAK